MQDFLSLLKHGESAAVIGGLVIWLTRIEPRLKGLEKSVDHLGESQENQRKDHEDLSKEIRNALSDIRASQAKVEGYIAAKRESHRE